MSKVFMYAIICTGMMLVMTTMGLPTAVNSILDFLGIAQDTQTIALSEFITTITALIAGSAAVGIIIGSLTRSSPESFIIAPLVVLLAVFIGTFVAVINYAAIADDWSSKIVSVMLLPLIVGYGIALVDFWRGTG